MAAPKGTARRTDFATPAGRRERRGSEPVCEAALNRPPKGGYSIVPGSQAASSGKTARSRIDNIPATTNGSTPE